MTEKSIPKYRHHTFLIYPDSAPKEWIVKLEELGAPIAISPLHDKDKIEQAKEKETAELKKAHYHVIYVANNPVTCKSVLSKIQKTLNKESAVSKVEPVFNIENMYNYLTHDTKDAQNKGKHQYDKKDIKHINNFDISKYIVVSTEQKQKIADDLCNLLKENPHIMDLVPLENAAIEKGICVSEREFRTIFRSQSIILNGYMRSNYNHYKRNRDEEWDDRKTPTETYKKLQEDLIKKQIEHLEITTRLEIEKLNKGVPK